MPIYLPNGQPVPEPTPKPPVTGALVGWDPSDRYTSDVSRSLTPARVDTIMTAANGGDVQDQSQLALEIEEKNWDIAQAVQTRRGAVAGLDWEILPPEGDESPRAAEIAGAAEEMLRSPRWDNDEFDTFSEALFFELQGALLPGFAVVELMWAKGGAAITGFQSIEQRHFTFVNSHRPLLRTTNEPAGIELNPVKFCVHYHRARPGARCRGGLIRPLAWLHCFANINIKDLLTFIERYGMPFLMANVSPDAWERDRNRINYLIRNFGPAGGGVFTDAVQMQMLQASSSTGDVYFRLLEYLDRAVTKVVLGQTATSSDGGGFSKDGAQSDVRQDILESDSHALENTARARIVRPWVLFNYGPDAPIPRLHLKCEPAEDLKTTAETAETLYRAGLEWDEAEASDTFGMKLRRIQISAPAAPGPEAESGAEGSVPGADGQEARETAATKTVALNGAQVQSMLKIINAVAAREMPRETGISLIVSSFGISSERAEEIMGDVGSTFFADPESALEGEPPMEAVQDTASLALSEFLSGQGMAEWFGPLQAALDAVAAEPDPERFRERLLALTADLPGLYDQMDSGAFEDVLERVIVTEAARGKAARAADLAAKEGRR